jgi:hypothetical protein
MVFCIRTSPPQEFALSLDCQAPFTGNMDDWFSGQLRTCQKLSFRSFPCCYLQIFGGDTSRTRKIADLNRDIAATEEALAAAKQEYEKIKVGRLYSMCSSFVLLIFLFAALCSASSVYLFYPTLFFLSIPDS